MTIRVGLNSLFLHYPHSGTGRYVRHLIDGVVGSVDLRLVGPTAFPGESEQGRSRSGIAVRTPFDARMPAVAKVWFEQVAFGLELRRKRLDLGHVPYFAPPLWAAVPIVVTVHDLVPILNVEYRRTVAQRLYVALAKAGLRFARLIITDSEASGRDLETTAGVPPSKIRVIPLGVDERFHPARDSRELAQAEASQRACGVVAPYLLCVTGFDRRKNVDRLIEAYAMAQQKHGITHNLVVVGALRSGKRFFFDPRPTIEKLGLSDRVLLVGARTDAEVWALLTGADAFVFPSLYEGFGLPPLEAMACGTPVLCSRASSLPEVVGDAGVLFDPLNVEAIANAIGRVVGDRALREHLSLQALERASHFTWSATAERTVRIYREALERPL